MSVIIEKQDKAKNNILISSQSQEVKDKNCCTRNSNQEESIFVLCETCYWCATYFKKSSLPIHGCPNCFSVDLSSFPILSEEAFTFDYDEKRGTQLSFGKRK